MARWNTLTVFVFSRDGRGFASRALKAARISADYYSVAAMGGDDARYIGECTPQQYNTFMAHIDAAGAYDIDVYYD